MCTKLTLTLKPAIVLDIDSIVTRQPFSGFFTVHTSAVNKIMNSMLSNGFSKDCPMTVFKEKDKYTVLDGHKQLKAAKKAGLNKVWVRVMDVNVGMFGGNQTLMDEKLVRQLPFLQFKKPRNEKVNVNVDIRS